MLIARDPVPGAIADATPPRRMPPRLARTLDSAAAAEEAGADRYRRIRCAICAWRAGWTTTAPPIPPEPCSRLQRVGAANLPVGRLWEGHMNALYLARVHGDAAAEAAVQSLAADGAILGVWGADGTVPVAPGPDGALAGDKLLPPASAPSPMRSSPSPPGPAVRLGLIDVRDAGRADEGAWQMSGMRATASGRFDAQGIALQDVVWIGGPGAYVTEPHFVGGVWRIAALQVGAALGLLERGSGRSARPRPAVGPGPDGAAVLHDDHAQWRRRPL